MSVSAELRSAYSYGLEVVDRLLDSLDAFPHTTECGRWRTSEHGRWTAGFWVGMVWLLYLERPEARVRAEADRWLARLAPRQFDTTTHDMGFLFEPSFVRGYRITGQPSMRDVAIQAARSLATRFHAPGDYIQAWDEAEDPIHHGRTIVDTVMNLPLLIWAARAAGEGSMASPQTGSLEEIALRTADTTARHHVRPDGSTYHVVDFDPDTGQAVRYTTHQGYAPESCWSRGQAWALYGFGKLFLLTGQKRWRSLAQRLADYFLAHLPPDALPAWDFSVPDPNNTEPRDSAAAAIAASGLLDLAKQADTAEARERYERGAEHLLKLLARTGLSRGVAGEQGILLHGTVDRPRNSAVDTTIIYGDHYFLEALSKHLHPDRRPLLDAVGELGDQRSGAHP